MNTSIRNASIIGLICLAFALGFVTKGHLQSSSPTPRRVTGIGGVFFKAKKPKELKEWYAQHLGFNTDTYGTVFVWRQARDSTKKGFTVWSPFRDSTKYFEPSTKQFMLNYRVENLPWLVDQLRKEGVTVLDTIETYDYGQFVHILDLEGNKIELWQPEDVVYGRMEGARME